MAWEVEFTAQSEIWWNSLTEDEQVEISQFEGVKKAAAGKD